MFAGFRKLDNLVVVVDNNGLQIDGKVDEVCSPYPIDKKFEAFNFHVINIDGNDFDQIDAAFKEAKTVKIFTATGEEIKYFVYAPQMSIASLPGGFYTVYILNNAGAQTFVGTIVK